MSHQFGTCAGPTRQAARSLLERLRQTPMRRGAMSTRGQVEGQIADEIEASGVPTRLALRIARQLLFKFDLAELGNRATWRAIGTLLQQDIERLKTRGGLVNRQIIVALPKLSADQIESFLSELRAADPTIARTVLNVALDAAEPLPAGRRYMAEYHRVADELKAIDPGVARTVANATFMARIPHKKAMEHVKHFADLVARFRDDVDFVRTLARAAFRAPNPIKAARGFIADYDAVLSELTSGGVEPQIARTLAAIASVGADPIATAHRLLQNFSDVLRVARKTHPWAARSIALSACRAADPLSMARLYMDNYDAIVRVISRTDPQRAREVAAQAFRSDNPLTWAKRYLRELQDTAS